MLINGKKMNWMTLFSFSYGKEIFTKLKNKKSMNISYIRSLVAIPERAEAVIPL